MDRRKLIKSLVVGTASATVFIEGCNTSEKKENAQEALAAADADRMPEEILYNKKLQEEKFFTEHELATISLLADIIIPKDETSGSATDARVPDFIDFIVIDKPEHQTPMRGGLRWLDIACLKSYEKPFTGCSQKEQLDMVTNIAYPKKATPAFQQGVAFFSLMRNLTITGFYTTEIGFKDLGYVGNRPNQWNGVPDDVLQQFNMAYSEKELKECITYDKI